MPMRGPPAGEHQGDGLRWRWSVSDTIATGLQHNPEGICGHHVSIELRQEDCKGVQVVDFLFGHIIRNQTKGVCASI